MYFSFPPNVVSYARCGIYYWSSAMQLDQFSVVNDEHMAHKNCTDVSYTVNLLCKCPTRVIDAACNFTQLTKADQQFEQEESQSLCREQYEHTKVVGMGHRAQFLHFLVQLFLTHQGLCLRWSSQVSLWWWRVEAGGWWHLVF